MTLTREQIMSMSAGIELDKAIGEAFRFTPSVQTRIEGISAIKKRVFKPYSTDIAAAWEVVEKPEIMDKYQIGVYPTSFGKWVARSFMAGYNITVQEDTAPLAICKAALLTTIKEVQA